MMGMLIGGAIKSFVGHLEGTAHAKHTIESYRSDLRTFGVFLEKGLGKKPVKIDQLNKRDLNRYSDYLVTLGLKTNTRRRKILTVRRFLRYLSQRKKLKLNPSEQVPAPYKVERIPRTAELSTLLAAIRALPTDSVIERRNRAMLWVLAETGCLVSELPKLRKTHLQRSAEGTSIAFEGKSPRMVNISRFLFEELEQVATESGHFFLGFNKYGPLGSPITPRGVELLVRHYAVRLGWEDLTPRMVRHSVVLHWHREGHPQSEIQRRLGLKTDYAFRVYQPLFKKLDPG